MQSESSLQQLFPETQQTPLLQFPLWHCSLLEQDSPTLEACPVILPLNFSKRLPKKFFASLKNPEA
jgi:hypothetical protein